MSRTLFAIGAVATAVIVASYWFYRTRLAVTHIEYLGERFELPRAYPTYEAYRNDPNNLGPSNLARIQELVRTRSPGELFQDTEAFGRTAFALKVPGYGMAGLEVDSPEPKPILVAFEVPGTQSWRYLLASGPAGHVRVVDDFVYEGPRITKVQVHGGIATYLTSQGTLREHAL